MPTSRRSRRPLVVGALTTILAVTALVAGAAPAVAQPETPEEVLSHFLCYKGAFADFQPVLGVQLADQFGGGTTAVARPHLFCNPVRKTRGDSVTRIVDRTQHLKAYNLRTPSTTETIEVFDSNQFGADQALRLTGIPTKVLVPTRKRPHDPPVGLDHFTCYPVLEGKAIDRRVRLKDQFGEYRTRVGKPRLHCNPAEKTPPGGPTFGIQHETAHLLCYRIAERKLDPPVSRRTGNQFERARVRSEVAVMLCVPSTKVHVTT